MGPHLKRMCAPSFVTTTRWIMVFCLLFEGGALCAGSEPKDIRKLSQHFNEPGADLAPWMFVPKDNIKELSTREHPGLVTLWEAGKGRDIKGILKDPIRIDEPHAHQSAGIRQRI